MIRPCEAVHDTGDSKVLMLDGFILFIRITVYSKCIAAMERRAGSVHINTLKAPGFTSCSPESCVNTESGDLKSRVTHFSYLGTILLP